jgi:DNA-binding SARP family transcriptional activator
MPEDIKILSSKLTAPQPTDTITRDRLLSLMSPSARKKLTAIVAGAGYGKTTLAAHAGLAWSSKTVWYRLDESDSDLVTFISYLVAGIRKHYPEFGAATLQRLTRIHNPNNELQPVLTTILSEMEHLIREDVVIVLDDFHSVYQCRQINEAVEALLQGLPPPVHLILMSRSDPSLPLSRLRAAREAIVIREEDLAFNHGEIEQLCSEIFDFSLDSTSVDTICFKMGGWVAGLILLCHSLRGQAFEEIQNRISNLRGSKRTIFNYLEENIYRTLSPEQKDFLIKTSILRRINATVCDRFLNIDYSMDVLRYLESNHLFTSALDEERQWYSYHQLFRDFLMSILREQQDHDFIRKLHREAGTLMEKSGDEDEAVRHYLSAEDFKRACVLLEQVGRRLFAEGRFQLLSSYLDEIPAGFLAKHPWIRYIQGQLMGLSGKPRNAIEQYGQAINCFLERKDEEGIQACLLDLGLIHFQTGNLKTARDQYQELLDRKHLDPRVRIEALGYQIYLSSCFWEMDVADRCFDEAMALLEELADDELRHNCLVWIYSYRAFRYLFSLDFAKAIEITEYVKGISPDSGSKRYPLGCYLLLPMAYFGLRLYSRGYEIAEEGLSIIREGLSQTGITASGWHSPRLSSRGVRERGFPETLTPWLLAYSAANAAELGKTTEALEGAGESLKRFHEMGCRVGEAYCYSVLSRAHLKSGNSTAAEQWARSGIEASRGLTIPRMQGVLRFNVVESLIGQGELEDALRFITEADRDVKDFWINLLCVQVRRSKDDGFGRLHKLLGALQTIGRQLFDPPAILEKHWIIVPLFRVLARGALRPRIMELAAGMNPEAAAKLTLCQANNNPIIREVASLFSSALTRPYSPSLKIYMLGKFRVLCGSDEIPLSRWKSRKARTLLQYLTSCRPRGHLNKEVLMELLWPEEDPDLTSKRFHVALASLRRTLEPDLIRGTSSSYISRVGDSYAIELGKDGWVDIEAFLTELRLAKEESDSEKALPHLLKAESLYGGDFLEDDLYSEWCCELRERFRRDYLHVTKRIVAYYERAGKWDHCIEHAEKHLQVDKYAEDIYRSLMLCYCKIGDRFSMARTFKKCRENIAIELNCRLSEETEMLFSELTSSRKSTSR